MKIGIIGAGAIGQAFAKQAAKAGYEIIISNSRGAQSLSGIVKNFADNVKAGSVQEAANADVIFLAIPWQHLEQAISSVSSWKGRIVIDATNPVMTPGFQLPDLGDKTSSEVVEELIPGASLVKAFNTFTPDLLAANPQETNGKRVIFFSGNEVKAKSIIAGIINKIGFAGIDLGRLNEGGKLQQFPGGPLPTLNLIKL